MWQKIIKRTTLSPTLMRKFEFNTDLWRMLQINFLICHHDKACTVIRLVIYIICENFQPMNLRRIGTTYSCLCLISIFYYFLRSDCRIHYADLLPFCMVIQKPCRLHKGFCFRINTFDICKCCSRKSWQSMHYRKDRLSNNIILKFIQKIIHLVHRTCRWIFNRKNRIIRSPFFNRSHCITECSYMKAIHIFSKELMHCCFSVSTFCSLEHNSGSILLKRINLNKRKPSKCACFYQLLILQFSAHRHQLRI